MVHTIGWRVASPEAIDFWESRLADEGIAGERYPDGSFAFRDPEGLRHELIPGESPDEPLIADHPEVPKELALQGFHGVRAYAHDPEQSRRFLEETLEFEPHGETGWEARGEQRGGLYLYDQSDEGGVPGAGTVHHVAWASPTDEHEAWQQRVAESGAHPTPVIDRFYFKSIYFREPSGVLFEIATIGPGFTADEPLETLGEQLSLPPNYEHLRDQLERRADAAAGPARASRRQVTIAYLERPAEGEPAGLLVLFHGRGADERDLFPLLDELDPERRLLGVTPRGPLSLPPGGDHWYAFQEVGYPDPATFLETYAAVSGVARRLRLRARRAGRLLAGRGDDLRARARRRTATAGGARRAERLHADRARLRARPGAAACRRSRSATAPTTR